MNIRQEELNVLRTLAHEYMEIASLPVQREKMELWKAFNRHDNTRPMVLIDQIPWYELNNNGDLTCVCEDPFLKSMESRLRMVIYQWKHFPVDMVVEPFLTIPYDLTLGGWGIEQEVEFLSSDPDNGTFSQHFTNVLEDEENAEKIKFGGITLNKEKSAEQLEAAKYIFDGILPVRQAGGGHSYYLGMWDHISGLMGVENVYIDLYDRPEYLHRVMEKMTTAFEDCIKQENELGIVDTSANICHCSVIYNDEQLPDFGAGVGNDTYHSWAFGLAQLFTSVSPAVTEEFEIPYVSRLAKYFQMIYYGCCDRLDDRLDLVEKIPNVKKVSCSPWSDREAFAANLRKDLVMSNKPTPAYLAGTTLNLDVIRDDLTRTCNVAKSNGLALEMILKDISTVQKQPQRLTEWADCAMKVVQNY